MNVKEKITYGAIKTIAWVLGSLPFGVIYALSDLCYLIVYRCIGYRTKVVRRNLVHAFPNKTSDEIGRIESQFYRHLCDWGFEIFKIARMSADQVKRRMQFVNIHQVEQLLRDGKSGFVLMGHCANWEFITSFTQWFDPQLRCRFGHVYRVQHNRAMNEFFKQMRARFGSQNISEQELLKEIIRMKRDRETYCIGVLNDQIPNINGIYHWTTFMNQETAIYTGILRIAQKVGGFIGYFDIRRVQRGHYMAEFKLLSGDASGESEEELTQRYVGQLEQTIQSSPPHWLWTHNRWKRKRKDYLR